MSLCSKKILAFSILALWVSSVTVCASPLPLHVQGNSVVNSHNKPVWLRGVDCASMEWTSNGEGHILKTVHVAIKLWHANIIRLPLCQDRWFGMAPEQHGNFKPYSALVHKIVDEIESQNCYVILDLHWNDADHWGKFIGQHKMPDQNSLKFWKSFAPQFKNNPAVIFDLYNEPHNVSWSLWKNGGSVTETDRATHNKLTYTSPGMQALLNAIRACGARNMVLAGGLNWAYDMTGFLNGFALQDHHGNGVAYANHQYPFKGESVQQWEAEMRTALAKIPIIVSEFGATNNPTWVQQVLAFMDQHHMNWTAWDLHPKAGPALISDWNYTPTPDFGVYVKGALSSKK